MNSSIKKLLIVFIVAALSFGNAFAMRGGKGMGQMKMLEQLDLTDTQKEALTNIREGNRSKFKEMHSKKRELKEKLREGFQSDLSVSELRKLHKEMQSISQILGDLRFENQMKIREILTKEQRKKFHELKQSRKGQRRGGHGNRQGPRE